MHQEHDTSSHGFIKSIDSSKYRFWLTILIIFHILGNVLWIMLNTTPPQTDAALHTALSIRIADYIVHHLKDFDIYTFLTISDYYPPITHLVGMVLAFISGYQYQFIQFTGTIFFVMTMLLLYQYAKKHLNSPLAAFCSVFFFSFLTIVYYESRQHMTDIPLIAFILACLVLLDKTNNLRDPKHTQIFFVTFALACLTKWTAPVFLIIPFLYAFIPNIRQREHIPIVIKNLLMGSIILLCIIGPWYLLNASSFFSIGSFWVRGEVDDPQQLLSAENILYYPHIITTFQTGLIGMIYIIVLCAYLFIKKEKKPWLNWGFVILFVYIFFTFIIKNKNIRILLPLMPYMAILMGYGAQIIMEKGKKIMRIFLYTLAAWYVFSYSVLSFGFPVYPRFQYAVKIPVFGWVDLYYLNTSPIRVIFNHENWRTEEVAEQVVQLVSTNNFAVYLTNVDKTYFNGSNINLGIFHHAHGVPANMQELDTNFPRLLQGAERFPNQEMLKQYLEQADVIVANQNSADNKDANPFYVVRTQIRDYLTSSDNTSFSLYKSFLLPDNDTIFIYARPELIERLNKAK